MAGNKRESQEITVRRGPPVTGWAKARQWVAERISPKSIKAYFGPRTWRGWNMQNYNGEKTLGELGPTKDYLLDYASLRSRGNQFYLDNEVVQIVINRMTTWVIGNGLQLESEPNIAALKSEGITLSAQAFSDLVEARINTLKESKETVYSRMQNASQAESKAFVNSSNGGGILVVLRVRKGIANFELIDGAHIRHFAGGTDLNPTLLENGNRVANGIEMSDSGEHVAFWVQTANYEYKRILAKSTSTGLTMAYMYGGMEYRIDNSRTVPVLSGMFQALSQMDEYKISTLASAKAQNDVSYQAVPEIGATGENVFNQILTRPTDLERVDGTIPVDNNLEQIVLNVATQTNKNVFAMPPGTELKPLAKNEAELYFEAFWKALFEVICAAGGIPPNVALQRFDTSFSSARAAIKDWEHTLLLQRYKHGLGFLQPWYELQLHLDILTGKVQAPGYLKSFNENNVLVLAAYRRARWVGDQVPHIDPLKEVEAERAKLGPLGAHLPFTTQKKATEALNGGSSKSNTETLSEEVLTAAGLGLELPEPEVKPGPSKT